jgi:hypothetical protein
VAVAGAVYDALTGGNLLSWCTFTGQTINNGAPITVQAGDLDITLD